MILKPFFYFYGGKYRAAPHYPEPDYDTIVEPFCGGAGYSVYHHKKNIILIEKDPVIAATWKYLIRVKPEEILALPDIQEGQSVEDLNVCEEARYLIGWWLNQAGTGPGKTLSSWARRHRGGEFGKASSRSFNVGWGSPVKRRIASQVDHIRHWTLIESSYEDAPDIEATWFIDPPYAKAGKYYKCSSTDIDFERLGEWCRGRKGQVMVCENVGANWLPFEPYLDIKASNAKHGGKVSKEALWQNHTDPKDILSMFGDTPE